MRTLVLHHAPGCALSQAVRIGIAEKGLDHELWTVDAAAFAQFDPPFLALNRTGQVPVLEAEGAPLTEAFLILCYLDERFPDPPLGGADPAARYRVQVVGQLVERAICPTLALLEWVASPGPSPPLEALARLPLERRALWEKAAAGFSVAEITAADVGLARALDDCEAWLASHPWLAGEDYSIADILLFPLVDRLDEAMRGPALRDWHARVAARTAVTALEAEAPVITMGPERGRWG
jgi:glutathione S-transferase